MRTKMPWGCCFEEAACHARRSELWPAKAAAPDVNVHTPAPWVVVYRWRGAAAVAERVAQPAHGGRHGAGMAVPAQC